MIQSRPLSGKRIVLTRHKEGNARLGERLRSLGAVTLDIPLISIEEDLDTQTIADVIKDFAQYEWVVFTSRSGVEFFFKAFLERVHDIRSLGFIRIAALGSGTAEALKAYHLKPDLLPDKATAGDLAKALSEENSLDNLKILVVTGNRNADTLVRSLEKGRAIVDNLKVYRTELTELENNADATSFREKGADAIIFASASAVQSFGDQAKHLGLEKSAQVPVLCSFGPATTKKMKEANIPVTVEADDPGLDGIVAALVDYFAH